jgi:hypothetical protein
MGKKESIEKDEKRGSKVLDMDKKAEGAKTW